MNEENISPEEEALRKMDNNPKISQSQQKGLDDLQNASENPNSLGRVERTDYTKREVESINKQYGFFSLDVKEFPSKGRFYRNGLSIKIKAATVDDIRNFSALDEDNPYEVDEALVDLLSNCVRVSYTDRTGSWKDVLEEDRIYLILAIRKLTFAEDENKIAFKVKCESCATENDMEIVNENFQQRELHPKLANYYSSEDLCFNIQTKSFGQFTITPPTVGIMRKVNKYIKSLQESKANLKQYVPFLKTLPYLAGDWRSFDEKEINNIRMDFMRWDRKKFLTFTKLCEYASISVKETMKMHCVKCHDPIEADVQLPTGIKGLFIDDNIDDELI